MYSLKIEVWKSDKYGNPDETKTVGSYYTEQAAQYDADELTYRLAYAGYKKFGIAIVDGT